MKTFFATTLLFASMSALAVAPSDIREPESYGNLFVSDTADIISSTSEKELDEALSQYHQATGIQVAVVTTTDTSGSASPRTFANKVFESFELGDPELDNGLLMLLSVDDRRIEFETGYGLEGLLPDVTQYRIQQKFMIPLFKQGDYEQGLLDGTYATLLELDEATKKEAAYQKAQTSPPNTLSMTDDEVLNDEPHPLSFLAFILSVFFGIGGAALISMVWLSIFRDDSKQCAVNNPDSDSNSNKRHCEYCGRQSIYTTRPYQSLPSTPKRESLYLTRYEKALLAANLADITFIACPNCQYVNKLIENNSPLSNCDTCDSVARYTFLSGSHLLSNHLNVYQDTIRADRAKSLSATVFNSVKLGWQETTLVRYKVERCFICGTMTEVKEKDAIKNQPLPPKPKRTRSSSTRSSSSRTRSSSTRSSSSRTRSSSSRSSSSRTRSVSRKPRKRGGRSGGGGAGSSW